MSDKLQDDYKAKMTDAEIAELAKSQHAIKQTSDYKFPTEIVELPSKGLLYPKDNPLATGKIEMKYMTAKEEDILTTQSYIKDKSVLNRLFQSLIVSNGEGLPIKYVDLVAGDKNAIMIAARILGYGKEYAVEIDDPFSPGTIQKESIDLTTFDNKEYDGSHQTELHKNEFEFELPKSKRTITFMVMTESKNRKLDYELEAIKKANRKLNDNTSRELTTRLKHIILSIDGDVEQKAINNFVDNELFAVDSKALRDYINEVTPDIDLEWEFISEETGQGRSMTLPMGVGFFWPE